MNILVTGCHGQLGNEIQLLENNYPQHTYYNTDRDELDITDSDAIAHFVDEHHIDGIINCAAYTAVDKAETDEQLCTTLNATAPAYLAQAIEKRNGWMVQISTDYVFDGTNHTPYVETDTTKPNSVYGRTKLEGEINVQKYCKRTMIVRTAWLYSIFGNNFVKTMIRLGKERDSIGVVFDQIGTPTYALDLARAIFLIIEERKFSGNEGLYHYSNEGVISWYDFAKEICEQYGNKCNIMPCLSSEFPSKVKRPSYSVLDKSKIKNTFDITIPYWKESLTNCIKNTL